MIRKLGIGRVWQSFCQSWGLEAARSRSMPSRNTLHAMASILTIPAKLLDEKQPNN
jgi:hypothetical protein